MGCLTTASEIRQRAISLDGLSRAISALRFIHSGTLASSSERLIKEQLANIGQMFEGRPVPAHSRIQEAIESQGSAPSDDWRGWFRDIVEALVTEITAHREALSDEGRLAKRVNADRAEQRERRLGHGLEGAIDRLTVTCNKLVEEEELAIDITTGL